MNSIHFEGIPNARDLGGLEGEGGKSIRSGVLLRSGDLYAATPGDIAQLKDKYAIKDVFDFRTDPEKSARPDKEIPGARYWALPTISEQQFAGIPDMGGQDVTDINSVLYKLAFTDMGKRIAKYLYPGILADKLAQNNYGRFLRGVLDARGGALWHCTQGKDRCGMGTAILLAALGVDRETIIADFDLTNEIYAQDVESYSRKVLAEGGTLAEVQVIRTLIGANTTLFRAALDDIDRQYGSLEKYMEACLDFGPKERARLQERYLV